MKKKFLSIISILLLIVACDDIPDGVVSNQTLSYQVEDITAPTNIIFNDQDSSVVASVKIKNPEFIESAWYNIVSQDGKKQIINSVVMFDNGDNENYGDQNSGDNIYTGKTYFGESKTTGNYLMEFYIRDNVNNIDENTRKVGTNLFFFDKGDQKFAPIISDLVMQDTIARGVRFVFTVTVNDENSLADIDNVTFYFIRPNNTQSNKILMDDSGDSNLGDLRANDGIFSFANSFATDNDPSGNAPAQPGTWTFIFQAKDNSGLLSNEITHKIEVLQ